MWVPHTKLQDNFMWSSMSYRSSVYQFSKSIDHLQYITHAFVFHIYIYLISCDVWEVTSNIRFTGNNSQSKLLANIKATTVLAVETLECTFDEPISGQFSISYPLKAPETFAKAKGVKITEYTSIYWIYFKFKVIRTIIYCYYTPPPLKKKFVFLRKWNS